jgi:hypothetical protein
VLLVTAAVFQTDDVLGVALDDLGDGSLGESDSRYGGDVVQDDAKAVVGHALDELTRGLHHAVIGGCVEIKGGNKHDTEHSKCSGVPSEVYSIRQSAGVGGHEQPVALNAGSHHVLQHLLALGDRERRALAARAEEGDTVAADSQQVLHMTQYFREVDTAVCVGGNEACWPKPLQQPITHNERHASAREMVAPVCDWRAAMHATAKEQDRSERRMLEATANHSRPSTKSHASRRRRGPRPARGERTTRCRTSTRTSGLCGTFDPLRMQDQVMRTYLKK